MTVPPPAPYPPRPAYEPEVPRPGVVTAAAVLMFVGAGFAVLGCCGLAMLMSSLPADGELESLFMMLGLLLLAVGGLNVLLGYYILQGRQWARITTIVLCALGILSSIGFFFVNTGEGGEGLAGNCLGLIINAVIIGLLSNHDASNYFRYARG